MGRKINADAQRHRRTPDKGSELIMHNLKGNALRTAKATCSLPKRLTGNEVLFLANTCTDYLFSGVAIIIVKPKNPALTQHDWNWDQPYLNDDWEIAGGKLVSYEKCKRIQQCDCVFSLLKKHFKNSGYPDYGWETQKDSEGNVIGLLIKNFRSQPRKATA